MYAHFCLGVFYVTKTCLKRKPFHVPWEFFNGGDVDIWTAAEDMYCGVDRI